MAKEEKLKTTVKGHGRNVRQWRDLGREGHGGTYAGASPYARQGIFVFSSQQQGQATREAGPGLPLSRRHRIENPKLKSHHDFLAAPTLCLHCHMLPEGHDRAMAKLKEKRKR